MAKKESTTVTLDRKRIVQVLVIVVGIGVLGTYALSSVWTDINADELARTITNQASAIYDGGSASSGQVQTIVLASTPAPTPTPTVKPTTSPTPLPTPTPFLNLAIVTQSAKQTGPKLAVNVTTNKDAKVSVLYGSTATALTKTYDDPNITTAHAMVISLLKAEKVNYYQVVTISGTEQVKSAVTKL